MGKGSSLSSAMSEVGRLQKVYMCSGGSWRATGTGVVKENDVVSTKTLFTGTISVILDTRLIS